MITRITFLRDGVEVAEQVINGLPVLPQGQRLLNVCGKAFVRVHDSSIDLADPARPVQELVVY